MNIKEAEYILNEVVIEHPSVKSYNYISAEEINIAIEKVLAEIIKERNKIKELEKEIIKEKEEFEKIIKEKELEGLKNKGYLVKYKNKLIKYIKKLALPHFWLEN